jgi:hypothetical protein
MTSMKPQAENFWGWNQSDLSCLYDEWKWPELIRVHCGGEDRSKDQNIDGTKAFLHFLYRSYTKHNLTQSESFGGWSFSTASRIFADPERWL